MGTRFCVTGNKCALTYLSLMSPKLFISLHNGEYLKMTTTINITISKVHKVRQVHMLITETKMFQKKIMRQGKKISNNSDLKKANFNIAKGSYNISIAFCLKQLSLVYEMKPFTKTLWKTDHEASFQRCPCKWLPFINEASFP